MFNLIVLYIQSKKAACQVLAGDVPMMVYVCYVFSNDQLLTVVHTYIWLPPVF